MSAIDPGAALAAGVGTSLAGGQRVSLCEAVDTLLNTGVVVVGDAAISLADVDLVYVQLQLVIASAGKFMNAGREPGGGSTWKPGLRSAGAPAAAVESPPAPPPMWEAPSGSEAHEATSEPRPAPAPSQPLRPVASAIAVKDDSEGGRATNGVAQLVLTVIKLLQELVERQALRRIDDGDLTADQIEKLGTALMRQVEELDRLKSAYGLTDDDLNLDLGPLGHLL
jgi:hypothetical protein